MRVLDAQASWADAVTLAVLLGNLRPMPDRWVAGAVKLRAQRRSDAARRGQAAAARARTQYRRGAGR